MNLKDLVMNVKDQELIITGIKGSSSYESRDHHLRNHGIIILGIKESRDHRLRKPGIIILFIKELSSQG